MKLVTLTEVLGARYGEEKSIEMIAKAGFDALDYSMFEMKDNENYVLNTPNYEKHVLNLKNIAESYGLSFVQAHSPFPSASEKNKEYTKMIFPKIVRSIEIAGILGVENIVVHPVYFKKGDCFEKNMELYHALEPYSKEYNVKIALENMWGSKKNGKKFPNVCSTPEDFNKYVDALDPKYFTACLDLGHCGLVGENAPDMIRKMGKRIGCLHIHDNDNFNDSHTLPYTMDMPFDEICKALSDIEYDGHFTYEADNFIRNIPDEVMPTALKLMAELGRVMIGKITER